MAKAPSKSSGSRIFNIMKLLRGNIPVYPTEDDNNQITSLGGKSILNYQQENKLFRNAVDKLESQRSGAIGMGAMNMLVNSSFSRISAQRVENRQILDLMPEVDKAARLMIASTLSPNDLTRNEISIRFDIDGLTTTVKDKLSDAVSKYFQKQLDLKKSVPEWMYQFGYESGASIFAIIPAVNIAKLDPDLFKATEDFSNVVVNKFAHESLFGFGDGPKLSETDFKGLEELSQKVSESIDVELKTSVRHRELVERIFSNESLSLTDNPNILNSSDIAKELSRENVRRRLKNRYRGVRSEPFISMPTPDKSDELIGDPIVIPIDAEAVTIVHTPGNPKDHQGYLILLDVHGNPLSSSVMDDNIRNANTAISDNNDNLIGQVWNAYGIGGNNKAAAKGQIMNDLYQKIVLGQLKERMTKAGFNNVEIDQRNDIFRCLFSRFLQSHQTRILFLPKDLVSYMTFEKDINGYGVSRLEKIKFSLGMKMAVQVSRVLASIKAAMDRRRIDVKFSDNMMEQPEAIFAEIVRQYVAKNSISFSIDPNVIQNQIADKSISISATDIPGLESFNLTNEPDARSSMIDFDPSIMEYQDKSIMNGLRIPPAAMNSLDENDLARAVATTNLFFAMDVSIDQDIIINLISDMLRIYARFSKSFREEIYRIIPSLQKRNDKNADNHLDKPYGSNDTGDEIPSDLDIDALIDSMTISLAPPNVAPSKAQFESLESMVSAISTTIQAMFPDEMVGSDDTLRPALQMVRAKFIALNIRNYLDSAGINLIELPGVNFTDVIGDIDELTNALQNISKLMEDKSKLNTVSSSSESDAGDANNLDDYV